MFEILNDLILAHRCRRGPSTPTVVRDRWAPRLSTLPGGLSHSGSSRKSSIYAGVQRLEPAPALYNLLLTVARHPGSRSQHLPTCSTASARSGAST